MEQAIKYVTGLEIGDVQNYRNISVVPLLGNDSSLDYLVLSEAIEHGFNITEKKGGASVPELYVENKTDKEVLAIAGEYVVGGMQNRTLTRNVYFAKDFAGVIPVRCVQQGRWHYEPDWDFRTGPERIPREKPVFAVRGASPLGVRFAVSQVEAWQSVDHLLGETYVNSQSRNLDEIYRQRKEEFENYVKNFPILERQVGSVAVFKRNGNKMFVTDVFDKTGTLKKYFGNLLKSYVLEAGLSREDKVEITREEIRGFLDSIDSCNFENVTPISLGQDFRITRDNLEGSILFYGEIPLYFNLFNKPKKEEKRRDENDREDYPGPTNITRDGRCFQIGGFGRSFLKPIF